MKVSIITEVRIFSFNDSYYVDSSFLKIIDRYNKAFDEIALFSRVIVVDENKIKGLKNIDSNVKVYNIGSIASFMIKSIKQEYYDIIGSSDLIVLRVPSIVSIKIYKIIKKRRKKYMCEIMGCAFDAYWNHGLVGKLIAIPMYLKIKKIIRNANYCLYVTEKFLQRRYPTTAYSINASNVNIDKPIAYKDYSNTNKKELILFTAAALNVKYKGQQYVIKGIKKLKAKGINVNYYLAGKGDSNYLTKISKKCGVSENVHILGMLSKEEVNKMLLNTDIYIQPSLQEGLPRSLIEAMNCGLVCIGANTAGIPELLEDKFVLKRGSTKAIINCINNIINEDFDTIGKRNMEEAQKYYSSLLDKRREAFYKKIIDELNHNR